MGLILYENNESSGGWRGNATDVNEIGNKTIVNETGDDENIV